MKCSNCSKEIKPDLAFCPHCGAKVPKMTPEQAAAGIAFMDALDKKMHSTLREDPEGIAATRRYLDAARQLVDKFSRTFKVFCADYSPARAKPLLLSDAKWVMSAKVMLLAVIAAAHGGPDPEKPTIEIPEMPDGCFSVEFELMKIQLHTKDMVERYMAFLDHGATADLEAAREAAAILEERLPGALRAIDKLAHSIGAPV